jgi:hypothetical protein
MKTEKRIMTVEAICAIEKVLLGNADLCGLYERRGVSRDDLRVVFELAQKQALSKSHKISGR